MSGLRFCWGIAACLSVMYAGPITYSSVSCSVGNESVHQTVSAERFCDVSLSLPPPGTSSAYARASAGADSIYIATLGAENPVTGYAASASALADTYEELLPAGPVRPGFVRIRGNVVGGAADSRVSIYVQFGSYLFGGSNSGGSMLPPVGFGDPLPITLGIPVWIHKHLEVTGGSDRHRWDVANASYHLEFNYTFLESDGLTPVSYAGVEIPEPGYSLPLLAGLSIAAVRLRSARGGRGHRLRPRRLP